MPSSSWAMCPLGDLADVRTDKYEPSPGDTTPYIALEHIAQGQPRLLGQADAGSALSAKTRFQAGDILYGKLRPGLRKAAMAPFGGVCSTDILALFGRARTASEFLLHVMHWAEFHKAAVASASGTKMPRTSWDLIRAIEVPAPPLPEQRKIAAILSSVDDTIERSQAVIDQLEVVKKGLLTELLTRGMPGWHKEFKETEIGRIPKSWSLRVVGDLAQVVDPQPDHRTPQAIDGGVPYVGLGDIRDYGIFDLAAARKVSYAVLEEQTRAFDLHPHAFVFGKIGTIGRPARLPDGDRFALSANLIVVTSPDPLWARFLFFALQSPVIEEQILRQTNTTSQPALGIKKVRAFRLVVPPREEAEAIADGLEGTEHRLAAERAVLAKLQQTKSALLDALLSGRVRVNVSAQEAA